MKPLEARDERVTYRAQLQQKLASPTKGVAEMYHTLKAEIAEYLPDWEEAYREVASAFRIPAPPQGEVFCRKDYETIGDAAATRSWTRVDPEEPKAGVVLIGPLSVGKSTIKKGVAEELGFTPLVTITTRDPRPGEVDGVDNIFVTQEKIDDLVDSGVIFSKKEHRHGSLEGPYYTGIPKEPLIEAYSVPGAKPFVMDRQLTSWHRLRDEIAQEDVSTRAIDSTLAVFLLPTSPLHLAKKAINRVVKAVPEEDVPNQSVYIDAARVQVDRALSDYPNVLASVGDPTLAYVVYENYDGTMNDIVSLIGRQARIN